MNKRKPLHWLFISVGLPLYPIGFLYRVFKDGFDKGSKHAASLMFWLGR